MTGNIQFDPETAERIPPDPICETVDRSRSLTANDAYVSHLIESMNINVIGVSALGRFKEEDVSWVG